MESLNEALATLINQATTGIDASMGFLQAEIPDVIVQLLMWHGVKSGILCLFGLILLVTSIKLIPKHVKKTWDWGESEGAGMEAFTMFWILPVIVVLIVCVKMINLTWLQIWIAPKVWLLEYAASLVK